MDSSSAGSHEWRGPAEEVRGAAHDVYPHKGAEREEPGAGEGPSGGPWKTMESSGVQRLTVPAALVSSSSRTGLSAQTSTQKEEKNWADLVNSKMPPAGISGEEGSA